ncbi:MAG: hypothetical protein V1790_18160 [Planctomycetota bacterium]
MGRGVGSGILATAAASIGGCVSASLGTSTGPHPPQQRWSVAAKQPAHVGETVQFDFVLTDWLGRFVAPTGLADYCVAIPSRLRTGIGDERIETEPDAKGHFRFSYTVDRVRAGEKIKVTATAYQQRGSRDQMKVRGQWLTADSPYAEPDRKIAGDAIQLTIYQTKVEMKIVRPADDLDPESGVLRLQRLDGTGVPVYIDKPGRPGFRLDGPEPNGYYRVEYQPTGEQLNPTGTTEVEFSVYDLGGQRHVVSQTLSTP